MADHSEMAPRPGGGLEPRRPAPGTRSADQIRADIQGQREELGRSVEALRGRVNQLTDWRSQVREHRQEIAVGAAVIGFAIGGLLALRRRR
jgi:uncharacterized protein DUF3618